MNFKKLFKFDFLSDNAFPVAVILAAMTMTGVYAVITTVFKPEDSYEVEYEYKVYRSMSELHLQETKAKVVRKIDEYIDSLAPNSSLNGIAVLEACDEYNIDVCFVLAQGQIESLFGTTGVASKTNSVWNVKAYDGRSAQDMISKGHGFSHPDFSIRPYLELLSRNYLSDEITEYDLMKNFKSKAKRRYASDPNYESKLMNTYNKIITKTNISALYSEYKRYKIMLYAK